MNTKDTHFDQDRRRIVIGSTAIVVTGLADLPYAIKPAYADPGDILLMENGTDSVLTESGFQILLES